MEERKDPTLKDLFSFDKRDISMYMMYTMRLDRKFKSAFNYLIEKLKVRELPCKMDRIKWEEGKSYDWAAFKYKSVTFIIRKYQTHFTIFFKFSKKRREDDKFEWLDVKFGCFTYQIDIDKLDEKVRDRHYENPFQDLNKRILSMAEEIEEGHSHGLWNPYSATIDTDEMKGDKPYRPEYIKIKTIWNGSTDDICEIDDFIFCCEELFQKYLEKFATTDMLKKIKTLKVGDMLGQYKILKVITEVKDGYYHGVGIETKGSIGDSNSNKWNDVYSLTRWYLDEVFGNSVPLFYKEKKNKKTGKKMYDMNDI